ncbi:MAG: hypothetical protein NW237_08490 [Cyanobacteriota bacterium]|nr:hypothetical protein [Cyanobacteriota bacterium]
MSELSDGLARLRELIIHLEDISIHQPIDSVSAVLETIDLAISFDMYEVEASHYLLQISANLKEQLKQVELASSEFEQVKNRMREVGFTEQEIVDLFDLEVDNNGAE